MLLEDCDSLRHPFPQPPTPTPKAQFILCHPLYPHLSLSWRGAFVWSETVMMFDKCFSATST